MYIEINFVKASSSSPVGHGHGHGGGELTLDFIVFQNYFVHSVSIMQRMPARRAPSSSDMTGTATASATPPSSGTAGGVASATSASTGAAGAAGAAAAATDGAGGPDDEWVTVLKPRRLMRRPHQEDDAQMWHVISTREFEPAFDRERITELCNGSGARDDGADRGSVGSLRIFLSQPSVIWAKMELRHVKCYMAARPPGGASPAEAAMPPSLAPLAPLPFLSQGDPGAFQPSGSSAAARSVDSAVDARAPEIPVRPRARSPREAPHTD